VMGSPMQEVINEHLIEIDSSDVLERLGLTENRYFLVSLHRDENTEIEANLKELVKAINSIAEKYEMPLVLSAHPRLRNKIEQHELQFHSQVMVRKPFGFLDYLKLQRNARCVISDSGTISEESAILKFPAITVRNAIERPEAIDVGSILMTGVNAESILHCLDIVKEPGDIPVDYDVWNCAERVVRIVLGYTPYINKYVWHKGQ